MTERRAAYGFWVGDKDVVVYHLDRPPAIGDLVDFDRRGRWIVVGQRVSTDPTYGEYRQWPNVCATDYSSSAAWRICAWTSVAAVIPKG